MLQSKSTQTESKWMKSIDPILVDNWNSNEGKYFN